MTDSFELSSFQRPGWASHCEPALTRKVYWVSPSRGRRQRLDGAMHLIDLLGRRFAFMPLVAGLKAQKGLPIEDVARERQVLASVGRGAREHGLAEQLVLSLFGLTIELSKAVQMRQSENSSLDLSTHIRPALMDLGPRILQALAQARSDGTLSRLALVDLELLSPWLTMEEREQLVARLHAVGG